MEWVTCLKKAIHFIEDNLTEKIDISSVSKQCFVSPFYLQKGFQIIAGYSLTEYIRNRKMYESAKEIAETDKKIIDIALSYGYDTPESFTKAFSRFHSHTPSEIRKNPKLIRPFLPLNISISISGGNNMDYTVSTMWGFKVIGFEKIFSYDTAYTEIPKFWDEICEKYCNHTIYAGLAPSCEEEQAIIDNCIGEYGVCIDDIGGGNFRYLIAGKYTGGNVPKSMKLFEFPTGDWAKFECTGAMPESLQKLNTYIFKEWLPGNTEYSMSGYYNIEWYSCDGEKTDADYRSAIWLPVTKYSEEAEKRWGNTAEFKESTAKSAQRTDSENARVNDGLMQIFAEFGKIKATEPFSEEAGNLVKKLQNYISDNFYPCSDEILASLGEMYIGDERFKNNIDRMSGSGTAEFVNRAIKEYLK